MRDAASANTGSTARTGVISVLDAHGNAAGTFTVAQQGTSSGYSISGTVRSGSGTLLAGASFSVAGKTATTSSAGAFSCTGLAAGSYTVTVALSGYTPYSSGVLTLGANQVLTITLVPGNYSVSGTVKSGSAGLSGATVSIGGSSTTTGTDGSFLLPGIPAGGYTVTVSKATYTTYVGSLGISANLTGLNFSLVQPSYTVSGTVRAGSTAGALLSGAAVSIAGKTATTDANGAFSLSGIVAGSYPVTIVLPGYAAFTSSPLAVNANLVVTAALTRLSYTVSGVVKSSTGAALAGVSVTVAGKTALTGSTGAYSLDGIPSGTCAMSASLPGYAPFANSALTVSANQTVNLALAPLTYSVSGTVRAGGSSAAVPGAVVSVAGKTATSDAYGAFSVSGVRAGNYPLNVTRSGYSAFNGSITVTGNLIVSVTMALPFYTVSGVVTSTIGSAPLAGSIVTIGDKSVTVPSSGSYSISIIAGSYPVSVTRAGYLTYSKSAVPVAATQSMNFSLAPITYAVSGTVQSNGAPLAGATVSVAGKMSTSDASGAFSIGGIVAGNYLLGVSKTGYTTFSNGSYPVSANQSVTIPLVPVSYPVTGIVAGANGSGLLPGAVVKIGDKSVTVPSSGIYSLSTTAGSYPVSVSKAGYLTYNGTATVTAAQNLNFTLQPVTYTISGTVKSNGAALAGAAVSVAGKTAISAADGTFSIAAVTAGTYALAAAKSGYTTSTNSSFSVGSDQSVAISLVQPTYTVSGILKTSNNGAVLAGASFAIAGQSVTSGANGAFTVSGILAGTYSFVASKAAYTQTTGSLAVSGNVSGLVYLVYQPVYSVSGMVTSTIGSAALPGAVVTIGLSSATVASSGSFSISGLASGSYPVSVTRPGYAPYTGSVTITATQIRNFSLSPAK